MQYRPYIILYVIFIIIFNTYNSTYKGRSGQIVFCKGPKSKYFRCVGCKVSVATAVLNSMGVVQNNNNNKKTQFQTVHG